MSRSINKHIALPQSLQDVCDIREQVREKIAMIQRLKNEADTLMRRASTYGMPSVDLFRYDIEIIMNNVDAMLWRAALLKTGLRDVMDDQAMDEFERSLDRNPPAFTIETVRATFFEKAQHADMMFRRGIVNVFRRLSDKHWSNKRDRFRVNEKVIISGVLDNWLGSRMTVNYHRRSFLDDIDRVVMVLDGKDFVPSRLECGIEAVLKDGGMKYNDDYYRIKCYKNGNIHLWFKRLDILEQINKLIAEYYDENTLADSRT